MAITPQFEEYYDPLTSSMQRRRVSSTSGPRRGSPNDPRRSGAPSASPRAGDSGSGGIGVAGSGGSGGAGRQFSDLEIFQAAVAGGFTPDQAATMVAIAIAESGGRTNAHNPVGEDSRGLWQINMDAHGSWASSMDLYDPAQNAAAALRVYQGAGNSISPWTVTHNSKGARYKPFQARALAAAEQAGYSGIVGNFGGSGGYGTTATAGSTQGQASSGVTGPVTGDTSGNAVLASANNFDGTVPADLVILNIAGQQPIIGYDMGNGVWGIWDGPSVSMVNGVRAVNVTAEAWSTLRTVRLGDVSELDDLAGSYGTFKEFLDEWLFVSGVDAASLVDPTVAETFLKTIGDPSLLDQPGVIERMLQESEWFQSRSSRALQWNDGSLSRAQKAQMIDDEIANVKSEVFRYLGQNMSFDDPKLREWGELIASGQSTLSKIINNEIKPMAQGEADSPWSRTLRDEERAQAQRGISYEDEAARIRSSASRWGVTLSEDELLNWGKKITENIYSRDDLAEFLKDTAQALYPWKAREVETATAAQPYLQAFNSTFETTGTDVFSPEIQSVMQRGVSVTDFAQELRNTDRWLTTENGRDEILSIGSQISRTMGFS